MRANGGAPTTWFPAAWSATWSGDVPLPRARNASWKLHTAGKTEP